MSRGRGFTLIEALVAVALVAVGVATVMGAIGAMTRAQARAIERENLQRLAIQKYQELVSTGDYENSPTGDFRDRNELRYQWETSVEPTGVENLQALTIRVYQPQLEDQVYEKFTGLVFTPPPPEEAAAAP